MSKQQDATEKTNLLFPGFILLGLPAIIGGVAVLCLVMFGVIKTPEQGADLVKNAARSEIHQIARDLHKGELKTNQSSLKKKQSEASEESCCHHCPVAQKKRNDIHRKLNEDK